MERQTAAPNIYIGKKNRQAVTTGGHRTAAPSPLGRRPQFSHPHPPRPQRHRPERLRVGRSGDASGGGRHANGTRDARDGDDGMSDAEGEGGGWKGRG